MTERERLAGVGSFDGGLAAASPWYRWGPYLAERAWGTVREDYSPDGTAWDWVSHDAARSKAYRWNEEGLAGICDSRQRLCLALALWNGVDDILKERCYGLTNNEGNHGEDAKEYWWYLDALPSGAWLRWRYHYPQRPFPYRWLREESQRRRGAGTLPEPELLDSGVFDGDRYWVVEVDYAKAGPDDIAVRVRATNAGPEPATLHVLPTLWFRNTWSWEPGTPRPDLRRIGDTLVASGTDLGEYQLAADPPTAALFCDNDSNTRRLYDTPAGPAYPKDGINDHVVHGAATVNPAGHGTKAAWWYRLTAAPGETVEVRLRLSAGTPDPGVSVADLFDLRQAEADEFYAALTPKDAEPEEAAAMRQAFAGLLWGRQYYPFDVARWLDGDPGQPVPAQSRHHGRDTTWRHLRSDDVFSMPDPWEYPWFASWDLAFHTVALAHVDPAFAKYQLQLLCTDRFQRSDGDLPAYEWEFSDVNPPVHAWAAMKVYRLDGSRDTAFLATVYDRLKLNFAWWCNQQDSDGDNLFGGGFLGLDNVGPVNRSFPPGGLTFEQADATAWMAFYCLTMLHVATELDRDDDAAMFLDRFGLVCRALTTQGLWDPVDGFFFDRVRWPDGAEALVKVRSIVGLIPLFAVAAVPDRVLAGGDPTAGVPLGAVHTELAPTRSLLTVVSREQLPTVLREVLDPECFLSPYGIRSLSRRHLTQPPPPIVVDGVTWSVGYEPAESTTASVNSNWRGPVWFPVNYLLIESLGRLGDYFGDEVRVEFPTSSGRLLRLDEVAAELRARLISLFLPGSDGRRPAYGWVDRFWHDARWRDNIMFFEYFHADNGAGLGASHQTGWTALVADLITGRRLGGEGESW